MKLFLIFSICLFLSACCRKAVPEASKEVHDTVHTVKTVRERDTVFFVQSAGISASIPAAEILNTSIDKTNKQAHLTVRPSEGKDTIYINCECDSMAIKARLRDSLINTMHAKTIVKTITLKEKYTPFIVKMLAVIGGLTLVLIGGVVVEKVWL